MPTIKCIMMRNSSRNAISGQKPYLKPLKYNTLTNEEFVRLLADSRNLHEGHVRAVLASLGEVLSTQLGLGHSVHLDGIGTFSLAMRGEVVSDGRGVLQIGDARVSGVNLLSDKRMQQRLNDVKFELVSHDVHSAQTVDQASALAAAQELTTAHGMFTRDLFARHTGISYSYASQTLSALAEDGRLVTSKCGNVIVYRMPVGTDKRG